MARHVSALAEVEVEVVRGIPVTSPHRTLLDLAAVLHPRQIGSVVNEAEVLGLRDRVSFADLLARHRGRRGVARLRAVLLDRPTGITRSRLERAFLAFLDQRGFPRPRFNSDLAVRGRFFEVDCLWPDRKLIAELDGRAAHDTARAFERDRERDRILLAEGWRTTRVTWRQLEEEPEAIASDLRTLLLGRNAF
jgi:very-short-patch-repair endonuclease